MTVAIKFDRLKDHLGWMYVTQPLERRNNSTLAILLLNDQRLAERCLRILNTAVDIASTPLHTAVDQDGSSDRPSTKNFPLMSPFVALAEMTLGSPASLSVQSVTSELFVSTTVQIPGRTVSKVKIPDEYVTVVATGLPEKSTKTKEHQ